MVALRLSAATHLKYSVQSRIGMQTGINKHSNLGLSFVSTLSWLCYEVKLCKASNTRFLHFKNGIAICQHLKDFMNVKSNNACKTVYYNTQ